MTAPVNRRASYADLDAVPPHLVGELIGGRLVTHEFGDWRSASARVELAISLGPALERNGGEWLFLFGPEVHVGSDVLVPDIAGWRRLSRTAERDWSERVTARPDWVCEVLSPSTAVRDRSDKRRIYSELGVPHLWLVEPHTKILESFALTGGRWMLLQTAVLNDEVRAAPLDAISFPLSDLFPFDAPASPATPSTEA
jgi:Uma2 family endonuclease